MSLSAFAVTPEGEAPLSPCIRQCRFDETRSVCLSCRRTRSEITAWGRMDNAARRAVMDSLPHRPDPTQRTS